MDKNKIRSLAIALLNDEDGINEEGYQQLSALLVETGNEDVLRAVQSAAGRFYLGEDDAEDLKA